jgi:phospholipase/lecithinase/hemolysin
MESPMSLLRDLNRRLPNWLAPLGAVVAAVAVLAACGGGTSQVQSFRPDRVVVLGDENSMIADATDAEGKHDGYKYTINDRSSTSTGKCTALPTFAQSVASLYGFVFKECNPTDATPKAIIAAVENATVGDVVSGLKQQVINVNGGLGNTDLVTVMIGLHDILEVYAQVKGGFLGEAGALAEIKRRGQAAASVVTNDILKTGARALVFTIPDLGLSPYAVTEQLSRSNAKSLLSQMTYDFNAELRANITPSDGRQWGLVLADDVVTTMSKFPTSYLASPAVADVAACDAALAPSVTQCTTTTLVSGASSTSHLWADDTHIGPQAHSRIGSLAQTRALNNPF